MNEPQTRAQQLIEAARKGHDPSARDAARVRANLSARLRAEPLLIAPTPVTPKANGLLAKLLLALGVGATLGFAAGLFAAPTYGTAALPPTLAPVPGPTETPPQQSAPPPPQQPEPQQQRPRQQPLPLSPLKAELEGLRRAQELLHQGDAAWALARLDELDRAKASSLLLEERTATRAMAECVLGKNGPAQITAFSRQFPNSAHLEQVRTSCAERTGRAAPSRRDEPAQTEIERSRHQ